MIDVDHRLLTADTLKSLLTEIILREGTDYGAQELQHDTKINRLMAQLDKGHLKIQYCEDEECCDLVKVD